MAEKVKVVIDVTDNGSSDVADKVNSKIKSVSDTADNASSRFGNLTEKLAGIKGPVGQAVQGIQGLGTAFKMLMANPIVALITAIVAALTGLYKAFVSTKAGAELVEQVMAALGAALDVVRDRVLQFAGGIMKLFSGDIKGGLTDLKNSFSGVGDEIAREAMEAAKLKKELQNIVDSERELNKNRALQNRLIADAKLRINDETLSLNDRLKALEEIRKSEIKLAKDEEALAKRRYEAIVAQNALSDSSKEALDEEAAAYITLQNAQVASLAKQKELFDQEKALRDRQKAEQKAAHEAEKQRRKEREEAAQKEFDDWLAIEVKKAETAEANAKFVKEREEKAKADADKEFEEWLKIETEKAEVAASNAKFVADREEKARQEKLKAEKEASDAAIALKKAEFDAQMELIQASSSALKTLSGILGEQTQEGKVLAIASTIMDTYMGATKALAAGAGTPVGYINAAAIIATGLNNLKTITAVQVPNSSGASPSVSTPQMPSGPSVGIIQGQMSQTSQLQADLNRQMSKPTRAYVVGQNVTSQQSLDRHIQQNATL